jgi:hypothetical protein
MSVAWRNVKKDVTVWSLQQPSSERDDDGKTAKKPKAVKAKKPESIARVAIPWAKLKQLWDAGKSYLEMAKATDPHFDVNNPDATKTTRAKISIAMNKGVTIDGKLVRFKRRERTKGAVVSKKASKNKAQAKSTKAKAVKINTAKTLKPGKEGKAQETTRATETSEAAELAPATTD